MRREGSERIQEFRRYEEERNRTAVEKCRTRIEVFKDLNKRYEEQLETLKKINFARTTTNFTPASGSASSAAKPREKEQTKRVGGGFLRIQRQA